MAQMLRVYVDTHPLQPPGADRGDAVSLRPPQGPAGGRVGRIDTVGGPTLHALEELRNVGRGMQAHEHMDVSRHDPKRQDTRPSLSGKDRQVFTEIQRTPTVERGNPISRRPDEVYMQAMMHHSQSFRQSGLGHGTVHRGPWHLYARVELAAGSRGSADVAKATRSPCHGTRRFSDICRAVALATCSWATTPVATHPR